MKIQRCILPIAAAAALSFICNVASAETKSKHAKDTQRPDASVKLSGTSVGLGLGFSWGSGVLIYKGKQYLFSVQGLSAGDIGASSAEAHGDVYGLKKLADFNGTYASASAGAAAGDGGGASMMRNGNGVSINLVGTSRGVKLKAALDGVRIQLKDSNAHR